MARGSRHDHHVRRPAVQPCAGDGLCVRRARSVGASCSCASRTRAARQLPMNGQRAARSPRGRGGAARLARRVRAAERCHGGRRERAPRQGPAAVRRAGGRLERTRRRWATSTCMREVREQMRLGLAGNGAPFDVRGARVRLRAGRRPASRSAPRATRWRRACARWRCATTSAYFEKTIARIVGEARAWDASLGNAGAARGGRRGEGSRVRRVDASSSARRSCEVARASGLVLDPVYTGKAMHGLEARGGARRREAGARVLFLHTGGFPGLLAQGDAFARSCHDRRSIRPPRHAARGAPCRRLGARVLGRGAARGRRLRAKRDRRSSRCRRHWPSGALGASASRGATRWADADWQGASRAGRAVRGGHGAAWRLRSSSVVALAHAARRRWRPRGRRSGCSRSVWSSRVLAAVRDELFLRGVVLRATRGLLADVGGARGVRRRGRGSALRGRGDARPGAARRGPAGRRAGRHLGEGSRRVDGGGRERRVDLVPRLGRARRPARRALRDRGRCRHPRARRRRRGRRGRRALGAPTPRPN